MLTVYGIHYKIVIEIIILDAEIDFYTIDSETVAQKKTS